MTRAQVLALLLTLAIAAAVALSSPSGVFPGSLGTVTTDTYMQPLNDVKDLDVTLRMGAGTLRVTTADSPNAFEATIVHHTGVRVAVDYSGDRLRISDRGPRFVGTTVTNTRMHGGLRCGAGSASSAWTFRGVGTRRRTWMSGAESAGWCSFCPRGWARASTRGGAWAR